MTEPTEGEVRIQNLAKRYCAFTAVADFTATIPSGQFFSLLGPSGSGKTTTLMMVAGFTEPDSGSIAFGKQDVTGLLPQQRGLGMVFQNYALFPHLSVFENVAFPLRLRRIPGAALRKQVTAMLDSVALTRLAGARIRELSGGQQQRVALARAMVFNPKIVLMDEPLGALDKNLRYRMQLEIKEIQQRFGTTILYVTHDQEEAMNMSDVMAIMNNGRIEQLGRPRAIYEHPDTVFVARFLGEANLLAGASSLQDGYAGLRTPAGHVLAAEAAGAVVDADACLFVRPEKIGIALGRAAVPGTPANRLDGHIRSVSFLGNVVRYGVDIGTAEPLLVDVPNGAACATHDPGAAVTAYWELRHSRILAHA